MIITITPNRKKMDSSAYIELLKTCSPEDQSLDFVKEGYFIWNKKGVRKLIPEGTTKLVCPNFSLKPGDIPNTITHLYFDNDFNKPLENGIIPNSVTHLIFGEKFNQGLRPGDIPSSVTYLEFGYNFNQGLRAGDIPNGVVSLFFGNCFYQEIKEGVLPESIKFLFLGYCKNLQIVFPKNLIEVILHSSSYKILDKSELENTLVGLFYEDEDEQICYQKYDISISLNSYFKLKMST